MPKEKVTLTLSSDSLESLRGLVGRRSLSAAVDDAVASHVARLQHLAAVDGLLADLEATHGPVPAETLAWAEAAIADWDSAARKPRARAS